jgi:hypothetical protein
MFKCHNITGIFNAVVRKLFQCFLPPQEGPCLNIPIVVPASKDITTLGWKLPYWDTWPNTGAIRYGAIQTGKYHGDVAIDRLRRMLKVLHKLHSAGLEPEAMNTMWL